MEQKPFQLDVVSVRLVSENPILSSHKIKEPIDAVTVVGELLCELDREVICIINLKTDGTPINCHIASMGAINQALAEPRELFKASILSNAAQMIMVHNHLGSTLEPSKADTAITDRMLKLTELLGIPLQDHIIVSGNSSQYFSFREKSLLTYPKIPLATNYQTLDFKDRAMVAEPGKGR